MAIREIYTLEADLSDFVSELSKAEGSTSEFDSALNDAKGGVKGFQSTVNGVSFNKITKELVDVKRNIDLVGGKVDLKDLKAGFDEIAQDSKKLSSFINNLKGSLVGLEEIDPQAFKELSQFISAAEGSLKELQQTGQKKLPLKTELKNIKQALQEMELAGEDGTDSFRKLQLQAGVLEDQIQATQQRIRVLASDTRNIDFGVEAVQTITAGFEVGAGAAALFGVAEEDLQEVQTKLIALLALANGLQQIKNALQKESTLLVVGNELAIEAQTAAQAAYNFVVGSSVGALKAFKLALVATGIGAVIVAIGYLVANWEELSEAIGGTTKSQSIYNDITKETAKDIASVIVEVDAVNEAFKQASKGAISKEQALKTYNETLGKTLGEANNLEDAEKRYKEGSQAYINATMKRITVEAYRSKLIENIQKQIEFGIEQESASNKVVNALYATFLNRNKAVDDYNDILKEQTALKAGLEDATIGSQKAEQELADIQKKLGVNDVKESKKNETQKTVDKQKGIDDRYKKELDAIERNKSLRDNELLNEKLELTKANKFKEDEQYNYQLDALEQERIYLEKVSELNTKFKKDNVATLKLILDNQISLAELNNARREAQQKIDSSLTPLKLKLFGEDNTLLFPEVDTSNLSKLQQDYVAFLQDNELARDEKLKSNIEASIQAETTILNAFKDAYAQRNALLDGDIVNQQNRLDQALAIAEKGNSAYVEQEQRRLTELQAEREENARKQLQIDTALRASAIITALAGALAESKGNTVTTAQRIATIVAALAQGAALISSVSGPKLAKGTDRFDMRGGTERLYNGGVSKGVDKYPAWLNEGERVVPTHINNRLKGISNMDLPRLINNGIKYQSLNYDGIGQAVKIHSDKQDIKFDTKRLEQKVDVMTNILSSLDINFNVDKKGFSASLESYMNLKNKMKNV